MAVQIILKNSSVEDKRPQASQLTNGEISLNYSSAGAFLCCTDTNGDVQQVGGVKIDETAPDAPVKQTLWFKPSTLTLSVFDGDKWLPIAGGGGGGGGGGGDIIQIIGNDGIDADTVSGIVTLDVELAGGDDGLEFKSSKLSATLASATDLGSVKVGDNINVTAGKISVPKATSSTFGVVKLGDGIEIDGDGSISIDVPTTTVYRGSCDLNTPPTGQINPDPALKGDAYINSADAPAVDAGWTGITGSAKIGDLVIFDGTTWDLIPLGSGEAPVTSVNGKTGDVVLDYTDVGAASEAQGELADTALQPGDNITELNNDAGYITAAEAPVLSVNGKTGVVVLDAADVGALAPGDNVSELDNDAGYITLAELPDQEPPVIISATAPTGDDAVEGNLWFNSNDGRTYVYYKDGDSSQWVDASPDSGGAGGTVGDYWLEAGGYLSPKTGTNGVDIGGSNIQLNADGSINAADGKFRVNNAGSFFVNGERIIGAQDGQLTVKRDVFGSVFYGGTTAAPQNIDLQNSGDSYFAGDMAIGTTGSFTPSTPAISLNANGSISAADDVKVGDGTVGGGTGSQIFAHGGYAARAKDDSVRLYGGFPSSSGTASFEVYGDGSINAGGDLKIGPDFNNFTVDLEPFPDSPVVAVLNGLADSANHTAFYINYFSTPSGIGDKTVSFTYEGNGTFAKDIQSTSQNSGPLSGFRNQLINGDFSCWQRGTSFPKNSSAEYSFRYTADRWEINGNAADASLAAGLPGFSSGIYISNVTSGVAYVVQHIETGPATNDFCQFVPGSTWTLSYWMRDNTSGTPSIDFRGSKDGANLLSWTATDPVEEIETQGSWKRYSRTFTAATYVQGQHDRATVYIPASSSANTLFTGVQLEPGPVATVFERRPMAIEQQLCQRYYQTFGRIQHEADYRGPRGNHILFPTTMRVSPTIAYNFEWQYSVDGKTWQGFTGAGRSWIADPYGFSLTQDWTQNLIHLSVGAVNANAEL